MGKTKKMKKLYTLAIGLLLTTNVFSQAPEKMSYQAVVRDSGDNLIISQAVGMQISILQGSTTGTAVYVETQTPITNTNGLISLEMGSGSVVSGDFTTINWANNTYFIKTETDPTGGIDYTITGTTQLMSVPYALHAKTADSVAPDNFYLGQEALGGIIYYLYKDASGIQHGLVVNKNESTAVWQASGTATNATRSWDGAYNTGLMTISAAATYVNGLTDGGYNDWYLPSVDELSFLWHNRYFVNKALNGIGGATLLSSTAYYWSSNEYSNASALYFRFIRGLAFYQDKGESSSVRAIRAF